MEKVNVLQVYDADSGNIISVSKELQLKAMAVYQQIQAGVFISAMAIKRMVDDKLYFGLGMQSKDEFLSSLQFFGRSNAYKLLTIADRFEKVLGDKLINSGELNPEYNSKIGQFSELGIEKLYEITRLEDAEIEELSNGGEIDINNKKYTLDELRSTTYRELQEQFKKANKKLQDKLSITMKENLTMKEEIRIKNEQAKIADKKLETARELEIKYGEPASSIENKDYLLKACYDNLNKFSDYIFKANISLDDPIRIQRQLVDIIKKLDVVQKLVLDNYSEITIEFN